MSGMLVLLAGVPVCGQGSNPALAAAVNDTADAVMRKYGVIIDDVYSTVADDLDKYISGDKVHFNPYGVKVQAEQVAKVIAGTLQTKK
jgi:lysophospholipase L1-like esterase